MTDAAWAETVVELLDEGQRLALGAVVLADGHLDGGALEEVLGPQAAVPGGLAAVLADLEQLGLVRCTPDGAIIVAHAYVRRAVLDGLDAADRRHLHAGIAQALDARSAAPSLVCAHVEAAGESALVRRGLLLATAAVRASLAVGETEAALAILDRIDRLAALVPDASSMAAPATPGTGAELPR